LRDPTAEPDHPTWTHSPVRRRAEATDLASVINLANEQRTALVEKGLIKGEA